MGRVFRSLILLVLVAGCGSGNYSAPNDLDNACSIIRERPHYRRAMEATERKWGVPMHVQMAIIHQESKFIGNARTPVQYKLGVIPMGRQSSAYGYSQALDGTWDEYRRQTGNRSAKRDNIRHATDFMGWYIDGSARTLGISKNDARRHYLAYHDGRGGYSRGTYLRKGWLMRVASRVQGRSNMYQRQLAGCRR